MDYVCTRAGISLVGLDRAYRVLVIEFGWIYSSDGASHTLGLSCPVEGYLIYVEELSTLWEGL